MTEKTKLLTETLTDLEKQRKYHEDKLTDIINKITFHESVIKFIEDGITRMD